MAPIRSPFKPIWLTRWCTTSQQHPISFHCRRRWCDIAMRHQRRISHPLSLRCQRKSRRAVQRVSSPFYFFFTIFRSNNATAQQNQHSCVWIRPLPLTPARRKLIPFPPAFVSPSPNGPTGVPPPLRPLRCGSSCLHCVVVVVILKGRLVREKSVEKVKQQIRRRRS
ncbi:hypothetical protein DFJ73DRAFT_816746 [Zopfochytrium polystomum]|nr:hypothetical protein DFJ73DRAFT_816746 [Zopfochytrium polystomum]